MPMATAVVLGWGAACPGCGTINGPLNSFCNACGKPIHSGGYLDCLGCGFHNPWAATYCAGCGGTLPPVKPRP